MRKTVLAILVILGALLVLAAAGGVSAATLPGGTSASVVVASPPGGAVLPEAMPYTVNGYATIGTAAPVANTYLITAIDVSGSTYALVGGAACGNVNFVHDTTGNTILDCELAAARALNRAGVTQGTVAQAALVGFSGGSMHDTAAVESAESLDLGPGAGTQVFVPPATDANGGGVPDVEDVLATAFNRNVATTSGLPPGASNVGFSQWALVDFTGNTNFWAAVMRIRSVAATVPVGFTKIAVLLSDGESNRGGPGGVKVSDALTGIAATGLKIYTFAIGSSSSCAGSPALDFGTLQEIADATGATCTRILNPADAVDAVPDAIGSKLSAFGESDDGGGTYGPPAVIAPVPPATVVGGAVSGPAAVSFWQTYPAASATPGDKTLCVRATGSDGGGSSVLSDCVHVTIKARPTVSAGIGGIVGEGTAFALAGSASDGTLTWSASGGTGTCSFADLHAAATSVTCNDDGSYTLTLTAADGVNPAQQSSATLVVTNVDPVALLTLSPPAILAGGSTAAGVAVSDAGSNDTHACSIDWGDGSPAAGTCSASHTYATGGSFTVVATVTDDDGGTGSDTKTLVVNGPPVIGGVSGAGAAGDEGAAIPVAATVTDPDGDPLALLWSATAGPGVDIGATCAFAGPTSATTTVSCTDDGLWTITLTASDGVNPPVSVSDTLTVANVDPVPLLALVPPAIIVGDSTTATVTVTDAGANDASVCSIDWGDGSPAEAACSVSHTYLAGGSFVVTATATDDDGGTGTVAETLLVNRPPVVTVAGAAGNEGAAIPVSGTATDPDGDSLTRLWTATAGPGVDAGATCAFASPTSASTTVTCSDDGTWTITLTANDGKNPPVSASGALAVANVAPTLALTGSTASSTATVSGNVDDAGANDTITCAFSWGDGATTTAVPVAGVCTSSHTYGGADASFTVAVTATDDDSAATTRSISLTITLTAKALKQQVLSQLQALLATATRRDDIAHLREAIKELTESLAPKLWVDASHLRAKRGREVFKHEKEAVKELRKLLEDRRTQVATAGIPAMIGALVSADLKLAATAISDATAHGGNAKKLAEARRELARAVADAAAGKHQQAIDHARTAWSLALQSTGDRHEGDDEREDRDDHDD